MTTDYRHPPAIHLEVKGMNGWRDTGAEGGATQGLRALRAWHWRQYQMREGFANAEGMTEKYRNTERACATEHLGFVQLLNDFFPVGDTADAELPPVPPDTCTKAGECVCAAYPSAVMQTRRRRVCPWYAPPEHHPV